MITASLVLYKNKKDDFEKAIASFLSSSGNGVIWVFDNSPEPLSSEFFADSRVNYCFNGKNLGFGRAHNKVLQLLPVDGKFHLFLNPDIIFSGDVLTDLKGYMEKEKDVAAVMPMIRYSDGTVQRLTKLYPSPLSLIVRRFIPFKKIKDKINEDYEIKNISLKKSSEVPVISGCFLFVRTCFLKKVQGFDERFFMYLEDVDLVRRLAEFGKIIFFPSAFVTHGYAKESYKNKKLLFYHCISAFKYFSKWGWIFDKKRRQVNSITRSRYRKIS